MGAPSLDIKSALLNPITFIVIKSFHHKIFIGMGCSRTPPPFAHQLARLAAGKLYAVPAPHKHTRNTKQNIRRRFSGKQREKLSKRNNIQFSRCLTDNKKGKSGYGITRLYYSHWVLQPKFRILICLFIRPFYKYPAKQVVHLLPALISIPA